MHGVQLYASIIALEIMIDGRQLRRVNEPRKQMSPLVTKAKPQRGVLLGIAPFVLVVFFVYLTVGIPLAAIPLQVHDVLRFDNLTVGIAIGTQSLATVVTRQFAGTLCDHRGAKFAMLLGGGGAILAGAVYLLATLPAPNPSVSLALLLAARLISGLAESLVMTGSLAGAISLVGAQNTGKVMVWIGIGMYAAIALGSPIGIWLMNRQAAIGGFGAVGAVIIVCSGLATAVAVFTTTVARHQGERLPFTSVIGRVAPFGTGLALATIAFGAIGAFAALDFQAKGWSGAGLALTAFGGAYVFTRMIFGGWPDRFGGARVAAWSLLVECAGQLILWLAQTPAIAVVGAILTGVGFSLVFPSLGIEAVKHVSPASRGAALGAYVAFFDIGFGLAGPITGLIAGALGYSSVFAAGAVSAALALLAARRATRPSTAPTMLA
jgi:MFS family permease